MGVGESRDDEEPTISFHRMVWCEADIGGLSLCGADNVIEVEATRIAKDKGMIEYDAVAMV